MRSQLHHRKAGVCSALVYPAILMAAAVLLLSLGAHRFETKTSKPQASDKAARGTDAATDKAEPGLSAVQPPAAAFPGLLPPTAAESNPNSALPALQTGRPSSSINQNGDKHNPATGLTGLPLEAQSSISRLLGHDLPGYQARAQDEGFAAENARHKLAADFTPSGVELRSGPALWKLALRSYGYDKALQPVPAVVPRGSSNRVEYRRGALTEWYVNGPFGLEQGFTLNQRPDRPIAPALASFGVVNIAIDRQQSIIGGSLSQPLTIALALSGNLTATVDQGRTGLTLTGKDGKAELRYTGLAARDSTGKELRAWLELQGEQLLLKVEDATAHYPVVIDPWAQVAQLTASDGAQSDFLGFSVATSGDTVVTGAPGATVNGNGAQGAVYVFVKPASGWANMTQAAKLIASDGALGDEFGYSVAIDGDIVVAGAPFVTGSGYHQGAAYVFLRSASGWANMTQTAKLTASDATTNDGLGGSVAISGNSVVAGAFCAHYSFPNCGPGAAYLFLEPASGWANMTQTAKLTASDGAQNDSLGASVAISGNTAVAGDAGKGATYVFVEPTSGWADMTQTAKLTGGFPWVSVAVSGNTVVAAGGAPFAPYAAYVFVEPVSGWTDMQWTARLSASDEKPDYLFGAVAISGRTVVAGQSPSTIDGEPAHIAAYVFVEPASGWANMTETAKLTASNGDRLFGVAISGNTVAAATPHATIGSNAYQGAAYVFAPTGIPFSSFSGKLELDRDAGSFELNAPFKLGAGGSINPPTQPLSLTIGTYSVTIPPGSFVRHTASYAFEGVIKGVSLQVLIKFGSTPGSYLFLAEGKGANLKGTTTNPVTVALSIGNDSGTAHINAEFE